MSAEVIQIGKLESIDNMTRVLDKGYVRFVDKLGSDLAVVNAARASFAKVSTEFSRGDASLLNFLIREGHLSPFRHAAVTFEIKAPLMVARQHWKYVVGSDHTMDAWNETSRRYVTADEEFHIIKAEEWRSTPDNKKQGSGGPVPLELGVEMTQLFMEDLDRQLAHYKYAMERGVCAEQARYFLLAYPLYINYRWTASLQSILHFLSQRLAHDAQVEIQEYAKAVQFLVQPHFPVTLEAFNLL